jgi:hypothetical protein
MGEKVTPQSSATPGPSRISTPDKAAPTLQERIAVLVVFVPLLVFFGAAGAYRIIRHNQELATLEWPTCDGQIIESRTQTYGWKRWRREDEQSVIAIVACSYQVKGVEFIGHRIRLHDDRSGQKRFIDELLKHYPVSEWVTVHYDPEAPGNSCLRPGPLQGNVSLYHMSIGMLIFSSTCGFIWLLFPRGVTSALVKLGRDISK